MQDAGAVIARDTDMFFPTYARLDVVIDHGEGPYLVDVEGRRYLDFFGGLAVNALGYAHPAVTAAINAQAQRYTHLSNLFVQEPQVELASRLTAITGYERLFFCNTGTEATEAAVKLVRKWGSTRGRSSLVAFSGGFHGRTMSALSLMSQEKYRTGYAPFLEGCVNIPFNDIDALHQNTGPQTCAVFLEFLQGEGGVIPASADFIEALFALRERHGFLVVADEVQCGAGRTGRFCACEHWGVKPDVVLLAKAIGGGLPLAAVLADEELSKIYGTGGHGTTFGGNPVACAAGIAYLDVLLRDGLLDNVTWTGSTLLMRLAELQREHPALVREVRGIGCMIGMELTVPAALFARACLEHGLLVNVTQGSVVRMLPPFILDRSHIDEAMHIMHEAMRTIAA